MSIRTSKNKTYRKIQVVIQCGIIKTHFLEYTVLMLNFHEMFRMPNDLIPSKHTNVVPWEMNAIINLILPGLTCSINIPQKSNGKITCNTILIENIFHF